MIDITLIREKYDYVEKKLQERKVNIDLKEVVSLDKTRRTTITNLESKRAEKGGLSKKIGEAKKNGDENLFQTLSTQVATLSDEIKLLENNLESTEQKLDELLVEIPNLLHDSVPLGDDEDQNQFVREWGTKPKLNFEPLNHWDILEPTGGVDFQQGAKIAKSRFAVTRSNIARMERALINFMIDTHTNNGYVELSVPYLVNKDSMFASGQYPKFKDELFLCERDDLFLIPTTEVPLVNTHRDEVIPESDLPISYTGYSACFRREAGSYGRDVRGLIRQHQFQKVELVKFSTPETSYKELDNLVTSATSILEALNLHHRVIVLCSGDTGFGSTKTYDVEVWLPGQQAYREISSCSNCEDFQARRGNIRYRPENENKNRYLHTLNGSGLAVGRTLVAIVENYQQEDGSILVPEVLQPYMGGLTVINQS